MGRQAQCSRLLSTMARWAGVEDNVIFVIRKTLDSRPSEPYRAIFSDFVVRVHAGMDAAEAMRCEMVRIRSPFMRHVFVNMISVIEHNGDLKRLLGKYEYESFKIEEALWDNRIRVYKDTMLLHLLNGMVGLALLRNLVAGNQPPGMTLFAALTMAMGAWIACASARTRY